MRGGLESLRSGVFRIPPRQAGRATVHHDDGDGIAMRAKLRVFGALAVGERIPLFLPRFVLKRIYIIISGLSGLSDIF